MKTETTTSVVVLFILATVFVLYISWEMSQPTMPPSPSAEPQREVTALKQQIAGLKERVDWLEERLAEPRTHRELP